MLASVDRTTHDAEVVDLTRRDTSHTSGLGEQIGVRGSQTRRDAKSYILIHDLGDIVY